MTSINTQCPHCGSNRTKSRIAIYESGTRESTRDSIFFWRSIGVSHSSRRSQSVLARRAEPTGAGFGLFLVIVSIALCMLGHFTAGTVLFSLVVIGCIIALFTGGDSGYKTEWICLKCGTSFVPRGINGRRPDAPSPTPRTSVSSPSSAATSIEGASCQTKPSQEDTKQCSVCGSFKPAECFDYGNRSNRSYCKQCSDELAYEYNTGGKERARAYREKKRASWKKPNKGK